ncbi:hypothetical protein Tco_0120737 [Tanacetum coccineum]
MMANHYEDIQCAGFDTRPPMLDRSDFRSWQQRIRFYCLGKDNGENILKSIDEDLFKMGKFRETLAEGTECALHQGLEWDRVFADLTSEEKERFKVDINALGRFTKLINDMRNIKMTMPKMQLNSKFVNNMLPEWGRFVTVVKLNRGLKQSNYDQLYAYYGNYARGAVAAGNVGVQNRVGNANPEYFKDKMLLMQAQENGSVLDEEQLLFITGGQINTFDDDVDEAPVQDLALNEDNVFQADQCDAFDSDVDEAPTAQTMFMANLSSTDPIYDEAGPSYDSDILSEVQDHDNYLDSIGKYHGVHEMQNDLQPNYVVDSDAEYMSDSNIIPYEQYVKDNAMPVVQSNVSSVPNDALMMIINDIHEKTAQCVSANEQSKVVNASLTAELARYKEQVELYERRARFELNECEQKIDEQLRIIITDRNIKEESLKKELHSVKMQLNSTIGHNKSMREEVAALKKDFKQKENKYLEDFLDMKALKEKVEDKLFKQDQSLQTVHMLCKPKPYYDEKNKVAIGYKNPFYLTSAMQVQSALYNGHEIIFWSDDILKEKAKDLKEKANDPKPITVVTVYPPNTPAKLVPRALIKEVKEMKEIFEELKADVDQNVMDRKCDEIERKNLFITNENLIADCLSKEVFYTTTNYVLTVSRFSEMHNAYTIEQARCLELEAEISKLKHNIQKDDHSDIDNHLFLLGKDSLKFAN